MTLLAVGVLGARSRLRRNRWIGIRTPATMRSEPAFARAHRVGAVPAGAAGVVALMGGAVLLVGSESAVLDGVVLAVAAIGHARAGRVRRAGGRPGRRRGPARPGRRLRRQLRGLRSGGRLPGPATAGSGAASRHG